MPNRLDLPGVVFDVNVYVAAVAFGPPSDFTTWPSPPPLSSHPSADCLGILNDAKEFSLFISHHILRNVVKVLSQPSPNGLGWNAEVTTAYITVLRDIVLASGGDILSPTVGSITDCEDYEDNRILELASAADARLIVARDRHLLEMSPWRGTPILTPGEFASRVDVMRRLR